MLHHEPDGPTPPETVQEWADLQMKTWAMLRAKRKIDDFIAWMKDPNWIPGSSPETWDTPPFDGRALVIA